MQAFPGPAFFYPGSGETTAVFSALGKQSVGSFTSRNFQAGLVWEGADQSRPKGRVFCLTPEAKGQGAKLFLPPKLAKNVTSIRKALLHKSPSLKLPVKKR
jgi:hypothetical protein